MFHFIVPLATDSGVQFDTSIIDKTMEPTLNERKPQKKSRHKTEIFP